MAPKRHHYLPQFYLRGFLKHNRNQLTAIKIDNGDFFKTDPKNIGCETDWNRICDDRTSVEEHFAKIDGTTSQILNKIAKDEALPTETDDIALLFYFLARLSIHNPSMRESLKMAEIDRFKHFGRWKTSSPGIYYETRKDQDPQELIPYEHMKRFIEKNKYKINFDHGYFLKHETKFIEEELIPILCNLQWTLLIAKDPTENFVCSDRPTFMRTVFTQLPGEPGFTPGVTFSLPLNRHICLYGDSQNIYPEKYYIHKVGRGDDSATSVPSLNSGTIYGAQRHIYSGDLNWEMTTASGEKRNANSLIGKKIKDVIHAWYKQYHFEDNSLKALALKTVRQ